MGSRAQCVASLPTHILFRALPAPPSSLGGLLGTRCQLVLLFWVLLVWRVLVQEDQLCLSLHVCAVIYRQKNPQVTKEVRPRPMCRHRSQ